MAGPPSPLNPAVPVPAIVVIIPLNETFRNPPVVAICDEEVAICIHRHPCGNCN